MPAPTTAPAQSPWTIERVYDTNTGRDSKLALRIGSESVALTLVNDDAPLVDRDAKAHVAGLITKAADKLLADGALAEARAAGERLADVERQLRTAERKAEQTRLAHAQAVDSPCADAAAVDRARDDHERAVDAIEPLRRLRADAHRQLDGRVRRALGELSAEWYGVEAALLEPAKKRHLAAKQKLVDSVGPLLGELLDAAFGTLAVHTAIRQGERVFREHVRGRLVQTLGEELVERIESERSGVASTAG